MKRSTLPMNMGSRNDLNVAKALNDHPLFVKCITNIYESMKVS